jgi:hypothetical protein
MEQGELFEQTISHHDSQEEERDMMKGLQTR